MPTISTDLTVSRKDLSQARFVETELPEAAALAPGQALLKVDEFALPTVLFWHYRRFKRLG